MRLNTAILPTYSWAAGRRVRRRAEELGFHAAYTYDNLAWPRFGDRPWYGSIPRLTAAATATERIRLGTLVSPNFRHPVPLAKELITLDDISDGRVTLTIGTGGAGGTGFDASELGHRPWSRSERESAFAEFVPLLDRLLTEPVVTSEGRFYSALQAHNAPGCVQRPRIPLVVAASAPRQLRLAARHAQGWATFGDPHNPRAIPVADCPRIVRTQLDKLQLACAEINRDARGLDRILLQGITAERPTQSLDAFVDYAGRYAEIGITEIVIHWPVPDRIFDTGLAVFERIATEGLAQLGRTPPGLPPRHGPLNTGVAPPAA